MSLVVFRFALLLFIFRWRHGLVFFKNSVLFVCYSVLMEETTVDSTLSLFYLIVEKKGKKVNIFNLLFDPVK